MTTDSKNALDTRSAPIPFDPFELQDVVSGNIRDPYPRFAELRRQAPVHVGPIDLGEEVPEPEPDSSKPPAVTVFGFDEAVEVLRDNETYSSTVYTGVMGEVMGRTILEMDEPEHRLQRALVSPTFRSKVLERWEGDLVQRVVNELVDLFAAEGRADLVKQLTFNFPVQVIAQILGLPRSDFPTFQRWAVEITSVAANWERGMAASAALPRLLRRDPGGTSAPSGRGPDERPRTGGGRGPQARRRGDLLVPPPAVAGRRRDDLPGLGQHALWAPHQP